MGEAPHKAGLLYRIPILGGSICWDLSAGEWGHFRRDLLFPSMHLIEPTLKPNEAILAIVFGDRGHNSPC